MKTLIAIPCYDSMRPEFVASLFQLKTKDTQLTFSIGTLIDKARNDLTLKAINGEFDRILWIDSDMTFQPDYFEMLSKDLDEGRDFVSGLYFTRRAPLEPTITKELGNGHKRAKMYLDYPKDSVFEIEASGFGFCLMKTELLKKAAKRYKCSPFDMLPGMGEDFSCCWRLKEMGVKMYCDSRVKCGHVGTIVFSEELYEGSRK